MVNYTTFRLHLGYIRVGKLEFMQVKTDFSERGLAFLALNPFVANVSKILRLFLMNFIMSLSLSKILRLFLMNFIMSGMHD